MVSLLFEFWPLVALVMVGGGLIIYHLEKKKRKNPPRTDESEVRAAQLRFYRIWTLIGFVVLLSFALYLPASALR